MATDIVFMLENSAPETRFELIVRDSFHQKRTPICELFCENSKNKEKKVGRSLARRGLRGHTHAHASSAVRGRFPAVWGRRLLVASAGTRTPGLWRGRCHGDETTNKLEMLLAI